MGVFEREDFGGSGPRNWIEPRARSRDLARGDLAATCRPARLEVSLPAILALGEELDSTGPELLEALAAAANLSMVHVTYAAGTPPMLAR